MAAVLTANTELLREADLDGKVELLRKEFSRFVADCARRGRTEGCKYRLHWAGDIFSMDYAEALARAVSEFPQVGFWTYTRSFELIDPFKDLTNLRLYLSLDPVNLKEGLATYTQKGWDNLSLCYMGDERPEGFPVALTACPVDDGTLPLEGACHACGMCFRGRDIFFKVKR